MKRPGQDWTPLSVKLSDTGKLVIHLFVRQSKDSEEGGSNKALLVCGLPVCHQPLPAVLDAIFSPFGTVVSVTLHPNQLSAVVVYEDEAAIQKVLTTCGQGTVVEVPLAEQTEPHGIKHWLLAHKAKFPGNQTLRKQLDEWMEKFEEAEEAAKKAAASNNDDGWTVVTRKPGRKKNADKATGIAVGGISKAVAERRLANNPMKQLADFYTHQRREKQRSDVMTLQARFEADKQKIAEMKAKRRFKPQ